MTSTGIIWAWGNNSNGQLGNGTTTNSTIPVQAGPGILAGALAISAGNQFTVALLTNYLSSYLWAWGSNSSGQLGNGTNTDSCHTPPGKRTYGYDSHRGRRESLAFPEE